MKRITPLLAAVSLVLSLGACREHRDCRDGERWDGHDCHPNAVVVDPHHVDDHHDDHHDDHPDDHH